MSLGPAAKGTLRKIKARPPQVHGTPPAGERERRDSGSNLRFDEPSRFAWI